LEGSPAAWWVHRLGRRTFHRLSRRKSRRCSSRLDNAYRAASYTHRSISTTASPCATLRVDRDWAVRRQPAPACLISIDCLATFGNIGRCLTLVPFRCSDLASYFLAGRARGRNAFDRRKRHHRRRGVEKAQDAWVPSGKLPLSPSWKSATGRDDDRDHSGQASNSRTDWNCSEDQEVEEKS